MQRLHQQPIEDTSPEASPVPVRTTPRSGGRVQVIWGPLTDDLELANLRVEEAATLLAGPYNIAPDARALVNGRPASDDQELVEGDVLEFARPAGEKGARRGG